MFLEKDLKQEMMGIHFLPSLLLLINVGMQYYDKVYKQSKDWLNKPLPDVEQAMPDLTATIGDCGDARELFEKYGADPNFKGPNDVSYELIDPTWNQTQAVQKSVNKYLNLNPDLMIALVWFFACHGGNLEASQCVLVNEYDKRKNFYKIWKVESVIRGIAKKFPNSWSLTIFACCREVLDGKQNAGCMPGPYIVAKALLDERMQADEETKKQDKSKADTAKLLEEANKTIEQLRQKSETREEP